MEDIVSTREFHYNNQIVILKLNLYSLNQVFHFHSLDQVSHFYPLDHDCVVSNIIKYLIFFSTLDPWYHYLHYKFYYPSPGLFSTCTPTTITTQNEKQLPMVSMHKGTVIQNTIMVLSADC